MNKKENRGITLVALVITIIVLIILAGVSINAVMNGGLISNAKNARDEYNKAKQDEEAKLSDLEADMQDFNIHTPYKLKNGFLTGITVTRTVTETVKSVKDKLPNGYGIYIYDDSGENLVPATETDNVASGMIVKKDDSVIGKIVVFGDVNPNGKVRAADKTYISEIMNQSELDEDNEVEAADLNHDGIIDWQDYEIIRGCLTASDATVIKQDVYANSRNNLKTETKVQSRQNYVNGLSDTLKSKFEWSEENEYYLVKGIESGATVGSLGLPSECIVTRVNESSETVKLGSEDSIQSGDEISLLKTYNVLEITLLLGQVE